MKCYIDHGRGWELFDADAEDFIGSRLIGLLHSGERLLVTGEHGGALYVRTLCGYTHDLLYPGECDALLAADALA